MLLARGLRSCSHMGLTTGRRKKLPMYPLILPANTIRALSTSSRQSSWRRRSLLITLMFVWLSLSRAAQAVMPAPDGGYPNQNTAEGEDALFHLTSGTTNTAIGVQ